jgi:hypothetical protein
VSEQPTLFPLPKPRFGIEPQPLGPKDTRSYTRRLTIRNNALLAGGRHPATGLTLRYPEGETCGTCEHLLPSGNGNKTWYKCGLVPYTSSIATDIRLKWPACIKWEHPG